MRNNRPAESGAGQELSRKEQLAQRKREKAAAEAEAREKAAWIAQRKREEQAAAEAEAREKAAWIAQRKRQEEEIHRAERRAEVAARHREQAAREAAARRKAEKRAAKRRRLLRGLKIALLVVMVTTILLCCGWLVVSQRLQKSEAEKAGSTGTVAPAADQAPGQAPGQTPDQTPGQAQERNSGEIDVQYPDQTPVQAPAAGTDAPVVRQLRVELPLGLSMELDRQEAGLYTVSDGADRLNRDYVRRKADAAAAEFRMKTSAQSWFMDPDGRTLHLVKGAGQLDLDAEKLSAALEQALLGSDTVLVYDQIEGLVTSPDWRQLQKQVSVAPIDAHFSDSSYEVIPGTPGLSFDIAQARSLWLDAGIMEEILIPMVDVEPKVTVEELMDNLFKDCLGSQTSSYGGSTRARVNNINLAVSKIDGVILMPGETFSYNATVGERTIANGFQEAAAYASGEVVQEVGGGICQVSSTLYCASLYSRMTIVERMYHYFRVTYLPPGQDATVSWGSPDYKFRNDRDYPVKIVAWCDNDNMELTIQIWGTDTDGITVRLYCEQYSFTDSEYPDVVIGANVYLYIEYYDADGNLLETREGSRSTYHRHDYEIDWPPEKFQDDENEGGGSGDGEIIIDDGGGGGDPGGGDNGGDNGGGDNGGGDSGGGGEIIIEP